MFQIKWSEYASKQRVNILKFWIGHNNSESYSKKILKETLRVVKLIVENPLLGNSTNFQQVRRVLVLKSFSLYYKINEEKIEIVAFWDNRRNPENFEF